MFNKEKNPQTFRDYLYSLSDEGRLAVLNFFSKYGEPNEILNELFAIIPCCQTKKREVRINQNYLLWYQKETFLQKAQVYFFKIDSMKYCYYSCGRNGDHGRVGWRDTSGRDKFFSHLATDETISIFQELQKYVHGFDQLPSLEIKDDVLLHSYDNWHFYFFRGDTLYERKHSEIAKKIKDTVYIQNIQNIIWCDQWYAYDSEASDTYALDVYRVDSKTSTLLFADSEENAFVMAMELKKRVPHLLYGPNEEYKKIFKRDPAELMALAKSKINR